MKVIFKIMYLYGLLELGTGNFFLLSLTYCMSIRIFNMIGLYPGKKMSSNFTSYTPREFEINTCTQPTTPHFTCSYCIL